MKGVTLWLRVLNAVHEEIVRKDIHRTKQELSKNTNIKDSMREGVVQDIVSTFASILGRSETPPSVASDVLNTMSFYIDWIDLSLTMNMIPLIVRNLRYHVGILRIITRLSKECRREKQVLRQVRVGNASSCSVSE